MKKRTPILLLLIVILLTAASSAFAEPYQHPATSLVFPDRLAGLDKVRVTDYEKDYPGLGLSVGYNAPGRTLTIYLYNMGMNSVPDDVTSPVLRQQFEQAANDIARVAEMGEYQNLRRLNEDEIVSISSNTGRKALSASFSFFQKNAGKDRLSKLYLMGYKNHFLKIPYTYDKDMQSEGEETFRKFLNELAKMLDSNYH